MRENIIFILLQLAYIAYYISSGCIHFPTNNTTSFLMAERIFIVYMHTTTEERIRTMWYKSWDFCGPLHSERKRLIGKFLLLTPLLLLLLPLIFPFCLIIYSFVTFINLETGLYHIAQATKKAYTANLQLSPLLSLPPKCWVQARVPGLGFSSCLLPVSLLSKDKIMTNEEGALEETSRGSDRGKLSSSSQHSHLIRAPKLNLATAGLQGRGYTNKNTEEAIARNCQSTHSRRVIVHHLSAFQEGTKTCLQCQPHQIFSNYLNQTSGRWMPSRPMSKSAP